MLSKALLEAIGGGEKFCQKCNGRMFQKMDQCPQCNYRAAKGTDKKDKKVQKSIEKLAKPSFTQPGAQQQPPSPQERDSR